MSPGCDLGSFDLSSIIPCSDGYVYDRSVIKETVVSQFDLVCTPHRDFLRLLLGALSMLGLTLGCFISGVLADKWGRKTSLVWGVTLTVPQLFLAGYAPNYWAFGALR